MKVMVLADSLVGFNITKYLVDRYKEDVAAIICIEDNEIFELARDKGIPSYIYDKEENLLKVVNLTDVDLGILAWWPKIISKSLLLRTKSGFINTHNSLLPNNRGKHPYFWSIVEELKYGVTIHKVDEGIDTGDIIGQKEILYTWEDNADTMYEKSLSEMVNLFKEQYPLIRTGKITATPQKLNEGSFHYGNELDEVSEINLDDEYTARDLLNLIRAKTTSAGTFPPAYFKDNGVKYRVRISIEKE